MTRPLPFTQASLQRAIAAARAAGLHIKGIAPDGTVLVDDGENSPAIVPETPEPQQNGESPPNWRDVEA